jgi:hypothetical protein
MVASSAEPWFNTPILKSKAIEILGGSVAAAAEAMGVSYQAVDKWPDELPARIAERVLGVVAKKRYPELVAELAKPAEGGGQ